MQELVDRIPPQNLEAEQSCLGSMMIDAEALEKGGGILSASDFYRPAHQVIFDAIIAQSERNEPVDLITIQEELRKHGKLEDVGGTEYLMALVDTVPTAANVDYYARIVEKKSKLRQTIAAGNQIVSSAYDESADVDAVVENAQKSLYRIGANRNTRVTSFGDVLPAVWDRVVEQQNGKPLMGIPTGIANLDRLTYGAGNEITIIGGRPSEGKTVLGLQYIHGAVSQNKKAFIVSQEATAEALCRRMLFFEARVNARTVNEGKMREDDWNRLSDAAKHQAFWKNMVFCEDAMVNIRQLCSTARNLVANEGVEIVVIDYFQIVEAVNKSQNRNNELGTIMREIKGLQKDIQKPVVVLSQLSRKTLERSDPRPNLGDLREGGSQEAEADKVILIHNPPSTEECDLNSEGIEPRKALFYVAKHKDGPTGKVACLFVGEYTRFENYAGE